MRFPKVLALAVVASSFTIPMGNVTASADILRVWCTSSQIHVTVGRFQGAAGTNFAPLIFTNSGTTCTLSGVPAVQPIADAVALRPVGPAAVSDSKGMMPSLHTLRKGGSVSALIGFGDTLNYTPATCKPATIGGIEVSLGNVVNRVVRLSGSVCTRVPSVHTRLITDGAKG